MAGRIPNDFIQEVLARIDLVDLIDARVPLKRSGTNFVARCPFHNEKTPSFNVNRNKQFFKCFGCGAHGNAIGFLMDYDRLSFPEAIEVLADMVGLKVPNQAAGSDADAGQERLYRKLFELQDRVSQFYQQQLKSHASAHRAVDYLKRRGVSGDLARYYRLGYAPPEWRVLPPELPADLLETAGLLITKDQKSYDRFRDRIMFPIRDRRGRVVGFGGRVLGDETPKYLNSPETPVFRKHREVYGLFELLQTNKRPERIIVVEGYMDVIALAQAGITDVVATLGTATSGDHVALLFRFTDELVFCFDGDAAGQKAAWKALQASLPALREGRRVRFLTLPQGHDPDSLVRAEGQESFLTRIEKAQPFSDYFFAHLTRTLDLGTIEGRAALVKAAKPMIEQLPFGVFREMVDQRLVELAGYGPVETAENSTKLAKVDSDNASERAPQPSALRMLLALLVQNPGLAGMIDGATRRCLENNRKAGDLIQRILDLLARRPDLTSGGILEFFRGEPEETTVARLIGWETLVAPDHVSTVFAETLARLQLHIKDERLSELILKSKTAPLTPQEREEMRMLTTK